MYMSNISEHATVITFAAPPRTHSDHGPNQQALATASCFISRFLPPITSEQRFPEEIYGT